MPPVPVPVPGPAPARRPLWWDETECLTYYGMQSLHELFEVVGSQLTDTDVDVLSFLLDETCPAAHPLHPAGWTPDPAADEPEPRAGPRLLEAWRRLRPRGSPAPLAARHRPKCGVELLLELERRGYCSESRLGPLLELLRVLTRHDLLPFVSRKKRRTVSPERVSAVPVLGYGGEASVSSSQRPEKDCGGQTDLPPVCAGAQWSAGVESSRPSPSPQKRGRGRRRRGGGAAPERPGPAQGGPRPGQQRERVTCVQEPSDAQTTDSQCASPLPSRPPRPPPPLSASPEEAALRVSFCPTLPPLVSKGQRLESRRERDWVQSVFLSVRPSLRKKAHSGLLLARSQSARRQDIRLRVRAEYCEHDAALRSSVSSDKRQPLERQFELFGRASTVLRSRDLGSILCDIKFSELAYLDAFWADYLSGALLEALKGVFITDSLKRAVGQEAVRLLVSVDQDDYEEGRRLLLEAQNGPCCPLAPDAPRARQTRSAARS
ncbi:death effector domain-containing 1 isoform X2 [Lepisosteus oculatus]|uniref:death effector domain-containing 1 isoform X2 n=1 Tax=Lepisosteus oculatus TaxID=7918 RepID=UPI00371519C2